MKKAYVIVLYFLYGLYPMKGFVTLNLFEETYNVFTFSLITHHWSFPVVAQDSFILL